MKYTCEKCLDQFRKLERYEKHVAKCPGKVCRKCGKVGHLACGTSMSFAELQEEIKQKNRAGTPIRIYLNFD